MKYKYSICHPDKEEIEHKDNILTTDEVKQIADSYSWGSELVKMEGLEQPCYNPSLDFKNIETNYSLGLTAHKKENKIMFSIWFGRSVIKKSFLGLFGEKVVFEVIDKWEYEKKEALEFLDIFLEMDYEKLEEKMND